LLVPVWWKTTEIYRPVLPIDDIMDFIGSAKDDGIIVVNVYFDSLSEFAAFELQSDYLGVDFELKAKPLAAAIQLDVDLNAAMLKSLVPRDEDRTGYFHVFVFCRHQDMEKQLEVNIGETRLGWIVLNNCRATGAPSSGESSLREKDSVKRMILNSLSILAHSLYPPSETSVVATKFATSYRLSFTLVVADSSRKFSEWDIESLPHFKKFLRAFSRLSRFAVEFQVQYVAPLSLRPKYNKTSRSYHLTRTQMMSFIDSNNWNLDFGIGKRIHLALFSFFHSFIFFLLCGLVFTWQILSRRSTLCCTYPKRSIRLSSSTPWTLRTLCLNGAA
jgi:hypothetical protein